jgi:hypothetical protein
MKTRLKLQENCSRVLGAARIQPNFDALDRRSHKCRFSLSRNSSARPRLIARNPLPTSIGLHGQKPASLEIPSPQTPRLQIPCAAIGAIFAAADAGLVTLASLVGAEGYQLLMSGAPWNLDFHIGAGITAAVLYLLIVRSFGFYQAADILSSRRNGSRILWQWLLTSLLLAVLAFLFRIGIEFSRGSIICFAGVALAALSASRSLMKATLIWAVGQGRAQGRRVVVVGLRDELAAVGKVDLLRRFGLTEVERVAFPNKRELVAYGEQRYANVSGQSVGRCA